MLIDEMPLSFKDAVFLTENAFKDGSIDIEEADKEIDILAELVTIISNSEIITYTKKGKDQDVVKNRKGL